MARLITYSDDASSELLDNTRQSKAFYHQLFLLHEISISLSQAKNLDDLYRLSVTACIEQLEIDRMGILMIDKERDWMYGTWGTDDLGNIRSEADYASPMRDDVKKVIREMSTRGKVCVWHDQDLYEFTDTPGEVATVGKGWNAAIAIWDKDDVIGWIACDNLLNHKPFQTYQSHILRLFGSLLGEFIKLKHAEQSLYQLNEELENRILARTAELTQAQLDLEKINSELEQQVLNRTASLNEKTLRLEKALQDLTETQQDLMEAEKHRALNHLVIGMAHELNTPLGIIKTAASLQPELLNELGDDLAAGKVSKSRLSQVIENGLEGYDIINTNISKMADLVTQFKRLSVVSNSASNIESIALKNWLKQALKLAISHYNKPQRVNLVIHVTPDKAVIKADSWMLAQILEDLVLNSLEHGFDSQEQDKIEVSAVLVGNNCEIEFEDNGRGIDPAIVSSIYDPFFTCARGEGSKGLGLNLVYNLITQGMKGEISHYRPTAGGCGFRIVIPCH
ncbi:ATP-binding protein [Motilimonas sp. 1_MG-2023]|uniref:sensor histidine kinase n=1 Tax=Motilimonas sp. 1_MG-2023 TaxID=3062672 RepID=UPI0026E48B9A|nr:ATP-binding protein [Motilimonas sp. 1_MG-2023]MDO6527557.1 ATP-binding protein [Motilimonas sp. 1_MG-2023]